MHSEMYVGAGRFVKAEFLTLETWSDLVEWLMAQPDHWDIDTVRTWAGPGSMLAAVVVLVRYDRENDSEAQDDA